ncbi:MAG: hypothetical protein P857_85 [Candidatus Xenolissoclinum pacificiensis L6]|uniref:Uncharacterized protein n=1 Tax=Candidatus Xenolissoclinum pacificiensis L6 TaxID=1401685 RepID=W2UYQ7_9RICK|nr:MAG: hypothetical protein P857_85 [Candidatus Xenolissoclinum pacificiensis L6]
MKQPLLMIAYIIDLSISFIVIMMDIFQKIIVDTTNLCNCIIAFRDEYIEFFKIYCMNLNGYTCYDITHDYSTTKLASVAQDSFLSNEIYFLDVHNEKTFIDIEKSLSGLHNSLNSNKRLMLLIHQKDIIRKTTNYIHIDDTLVYKYINQKYSTLNLSIKDIALIFSYYDHEIFEIDNFLQRIYLYYLNNKQDIHPDINNWIRIFSDKHKYNITNVFHAIALRDQKSFLENISMIDNSDFMLTIRSLLTYTRNMYNNFHEHQSKGIWSRKELLKLYKQLKKSEIMYKKGIIQPRNILRMLLFNI